MFPIPAIFPTVTLIFFPVPHIFPAVTFIFDPIPAATIMHGISLIFSAVPHIFAPVAVIFTMVAHIFAPIMVFSFNGILVTCFLRMGNRDHQYKGEGHQGGQCFRFHKRVHF